MFICKEDESVLYAALKHNKPCFFQCNLLTNRFLSSGIAAEDSGLQAITEAVCHDVGNQALDADHVSDTFLHVICYLVNADMIGQSTSLISIELCSAVDSFPVV